jgi:hypothetical protein
MVLMIITTVPVKPNLENNIGLESDDVKIKDEDQFISINDLNLNKGKTSLSSLVNRTLVIGTDNNKYPGQGVGAVWRSFSSYQSVNGYYMMNYVLNPNYETRGWTVFDLSDLKYYEGITISSGQILWRQDRRNTVTQLDFSTMKSIPYTIAGNSLKAKEWYNQIGGNGTLKFATKTFFGSSDKIRKDVIAPITSSGISWLNSKLNSSIYDVAIGGVVSKLYTGVYGHIKCYDVRLTLTFSHTSISNNITGEVAFGDDLSGYTSSSSNYDIGHIRPISDNWRGYATWNNSTIKSFLPMDVLNSEKVIITDLRLRINCLHGYLSTLGIYHMKNNPKGSSSSTIFPDAGDGAKYISFATGSYINVAKEYEWDLGPDALNDFNKTLNGTVNFFAIGFSRDTYFSYFYSPKLVIRWMISNKAPIADAGGPYNNTIDVELKLDASGSYDPDNDTLNFRWDFDNDGIWDTSYSNESTIKYKWSFAYFGLIKVEVFDGTFSSTDTANITILTAPKINNVTIDIDPDTLNPRSKGKWITCYIEVPSGYNVTSINVGTILLNGNISSEERPSNIGDHDNDGVLDLMVKFDRQAVIAILNPGDDVKITIAFKINGRELTGTDMIRVLDK